VNHAVVVDASVAVKWVVAEELSDRAHALLEDSLRAQRPVLAPPLLPIEVTNAIYQRQRRNLITQDESRSYVATFLLLPIELIAPPDVFNRALSFARTHNLTQTYDALYAALAEAVQAELWTADERLRNALERAVPWVRWIGDYAGTAR
jgi:predicted nucleic acid-binding protein